MITIDVRHTIDRAVRDLDDLGRRQIPFATAKALTETAKLVVLAEQREIRDVFDRPTPYTLSSVYYRPAKKSKLSMEIGLKDFAGKGIPASKFLASQITGGGRKMKRFERALHSIGALPAGYRAVPGEGAKLDAYGNMQGGQIVQILSFFKAFPEAGYKANMSDRRRAALEKGSKKKGVRGFSYFVGRPGNGKLPLGVWQRFQTGFGSAIKPVLIFVQSAFYDAIFDFEYVAKITVDREFSKKFDEALALALRTAR